MKCEAFKDKFTFSFVRAFIFFPPTHWLEIRRSLMLDLIKCSHGHGLTSVSGVLELPSFSPSTRQELVWSQDNGIKKNKINKYYATVLGLFAGWKGPLSCPCASSPFLNPVHMTFRCLTTGWMEKFRLMHFSKRSALLRAETRRQFSSVNSCYCWSLCERCRSLSGDFLRLNRGKLFLESWSLRGFVNSNRTDLWQNNCGNSQDVSWERMLELEWPCRSCTRGLV